VPGRRGVEDDVIELRRGFRPAEQPGEFIEGGDFHRAGARELLLHASHDGGRQSAAIRADELFAIRVRRGFGVNVHGQQPAHVRDGRRPAAQRAAQHFAEIGRRVGADEQHAFAAVGQGNRRGTGQRGLADAALAREKQKTRGRLPQAGKRRGVTVGGNDRGAWRHEQQEPPASLP